MPYGTHDTAMPPPPHTHTKKENKEKQNPGVRSEGGNRAPLGLRAWGRVGALKK